MVVVVYTSSASANAAVKNKQKAIVDYLKARKIEFEEIDLCVHTDAKDIMRSKIPEDIKQQNEANNKVVIPPQVFNDDEYCGDYDMFFAAREMELLHTFFKVLPPPEAVQRMKSIDWSAVEEKENNKNLENGEGGNVQNEGQEEVKGESGDAEQNKKETSDAEQQDGGEASVVEQKDDKGETGDAEQKEKGTDKEGSDGDEGESGDAEQKEDGGETGDVEQKEKGNEEKNDEEEEEDSEESDGSENGESSDAEED